MANALAPITQMDELTEADVSRFWNMVKRGDADDCWPWTGFCAPPGGYGRFQLNHYPHYAHRIAYQIAYGAIPAGNVVCHKCDNPKCCNPAHLWTGTQAENIADREAKGRNALAGKHNPTSAKLTSEQVLEIRRRYAQGEKQYELAKEFGVSRVTMNNIVHRARWAWLEE